MPFWKSGISLLQDYFRDYPDTIDLLLKLVVNTDTRDSRYKVHSVCYLTKYLTEEYPDHFSSIYAPVLQYWFTFSGTAAFPGFPEPTAAFIASVELGYSSLGIRMLSDPRIRPAIRALARAELRMKKYVASIRKRRRLRPLTQGDRYLLARQPRMETKDTRPCALV